MKVDAETIVVMLTVLLMAGGLFLAHYSNKINERKQIAEEDKEKEIKQKKSFMEK